MGETYSRRITKTYLSQKPQSDSFWMAAILFAVLFLCSYFFWMSEPQLAELWVAKPKNTFDRLQLWQLVTSVFIHGDIKHFLSNTPMLAVLVYLVYGYFGTAQILILLFIIGPLINFATLLHHPPQLGLVGISGVVYALCGFWVVLYLGIERRRPPAKRFLRALGFSIMVLIPTTFEPTTSYLAHGYGFLFGAIYGFIYFMIGKDWFRQHEESIFESDEAPDDPGDNQDLTPPKDDPYFFQ